MFQWRYPLISFFNRNYSKHNPSTNQKRIFPMHDNSNANSWNILRNLENILDLLIYSVAQTSDWRRWQVEVSTQQESIFSFISNKTTITFVSDKDFSLSYSERKQLKDHFLGEKKHKRRKNLEIFSSCFYKRLSKDLDNSNQFLLL